VAEEPISKSQLDKLGDRLRKGFRDESDLRLLIRYQHSFLPAYESVWEALKHLRLEKPNARRLKTIYSIQEKLRRQPVRLTQIQDIAGVRLTCRDAPDQDRWAQVSERLAVQFGADVKYGGGPEWVRAALLRYSDMVKACEPLEWQHWDMSHRAQDMKERTPDALTAQEREKLVVDAADLEKRVLEQREHLERELEKIAALIEKSAPPDRGNDDLPN